MFWTINKNTNQAYIGNVLLIQATHLKYIYLKHTAEFHIVVVGLVVLRLENSFCYVYGTLKDVTVSLLGGENITPDQAVISSRIHLLCGKCSQY